MTTRRFKGNPTGTGSRLFVGAGLGGSRVFVADDLELDFTGRFTQLRFRGYNDETGSPAVYGEVVEMGVFGASSTRAARPWRIVIAERHSKDLSFLDVT